MGADSSSPEFSPDGSKVYVGSGDGKVYSRFATSGGEKWTYETDDGEEVTAVVARGTNVYAATRHYLYCIDESEGYMRWRFKVFGRTTTPAVSADGRFVYFSSWGGGDNFLYCIDMQGDTSNFQFASGYVWREAHGVKYPQSPALSPDGSKVYVGAGTWVYARDATTGALLFKADTYGDSVEAILATPTVSADSSTLYIGSTNAFYAIDAKSGRELWSYEVTSNPTAFASTALFSKDESLVFVGCTDGTFFAFSYEKSLFDYPQADDDDDAPSNAGMIVIVAVIVAVALLALATFLLVKARRNADAKNNAEPANATSGIDLSNIEPKKDDANLA